MQKISLLNFQSILIYLIPIFLLTGPFLPDLTISISGLIFIFVTIKQKNYKYYNNNAFLFYIAFCVTCIISSLLSKDILYSLSSSFFYFRFGIFALVVWYLLDNNKNFLKVFFIFIFFAYCLSYIDGLYQYNHGYSMLGFKSIPGRMSLVFNDKMLLGGYLVRTLPLLIGLLICNFSFSKIYIVISSLILISTDILIYLTGERTAIGLLLISTVMIIVLVNKFKYIRIVTFCITILILTIITINNPIVKNRNIDTTLNQMQIDDKLDSVVVFSNTHQKLYINSLSMFIENPLFGVGPKMYRKHCSDSVYEINECSTHPHNSYIQLLVETGIIGFSFLLILFLYFSFVILKQIYSLFFYKNRYITDYQVCLVIGIFITLWPIAPTQSFFNNWINIIYYLPIGFLLHTVYSKKTD